MLCNLDVVLALLDDLKAFAATTNIQRIAAWAREHEEFDDTSGIALVVEGATLIQTGTGARLELPADFAAPATPHLDILRRVLGVAPRKPSAQPIQESVLQTNMPRREFSRQFTKPM